MIIEFIIINGLCAINIVGFSTIYTFPQGVNGTKTNNEQRPDQTLSSQRPDLMFQ